MNRTKSVLAAIRGPILLITLGTLVSVDYAGGYRFALTWPVLIIVFGILKLAERLAAPAHNPGDAWRRGGSAGGGSVI